MIALFQSRSYRHSEAISKLSSANSKNFAIFNSLPDALPSDTKTQPHQHNINKDQTLGGTKPKYSRAQKTPPVQPFRHPRDRWMEPPTASKPDLHLALALARQLAGFRAAARHISEFHFLGSSTLGRVGMDQWKGDFSGLAGALTDACGPFVHSLAESKRVEAVCW
jgi:hypothetical protein